MNYKNIRKYVTSNREPFFQIASKYVEKENRILDVGSGDGMFAKTIGRKDVYMLEGNQNTAETLKKEFPNCTYGKIPDLPYEDQYFNLIHSSHLMEHLTPQDLYDFLKECDRCLKVGGYLIISAPLLWAEFYDDMSHLKPYNPKLFNKYLSWGVELCCTRPLISNNYEEVELIYRYSYVRSDDQDVFIYSEIVNRIIQRFKKIKERLGFRKIEKSGFTLVLRKS